MAVHRMKRIVPRAENKSLHIKKQNKKVDNKVLVVAQEIKFAKILAGNDKKSRDKILRHLKKWLTFRSSSTYDFSEQDFMRLWKGLFYCVWMSDKPLVQEDLCENISKLFECFGSNKIETSLLFYKCFLNTMAADWFGIDQHRLDKFLMFVRRMTRGILMCLEQKKWSRKYIELLDDCLTGDGGLLSPDHPRLCLGLQMHLADCWMEEVSKVSNGDISAKAVVALTKPFAKFLSYGEETRLASSITRNIFIYLARQTDTGIEYQEKLWAWKNAGFPGGSVDAMERVENDEDTDDGEDGTSEVPQRTLALDPRAGHVDTELPQLQVDGNLFSAMFIKLTADSRTTKINRNKLRNLADNFETLASGTYPYKMKNVILDTDPKFKLPKVQQKALDLLEFEERAMLDNEDNNMRGMNKRQRRKYLMKQKKILEASLLSDGDTDDEETQDGPPTKKAKKKSDKSDKTSAFNTLDKNKSVKKNNSQSNISFDVSTPSQKKKVMHTPKNNTAQSSMDSLDINNSQRKKLLMKQKKLVNSGDNTEEISKERVLKTTPKKAQNDGDNAKEVSKKHVLKTTPKKAQNGGDDAKEISKKHVLKTTPKKAQNGGDDAKEIGKEHVRKATPKKAQNGGDNAKEVSKEHVLKTTPKKAQNSGDDAKEISKKHVLKTTPKKAQNGGDDAKEIGKEHVRKATPKKAQNGGDDVKVVSKEHVRKSTPKKAQNGDVADVRDISFTKKTKRKSDKVNNTSTPLQSEKIRSAKKNNLLSNISFDSSSPSQKKVMIALKKNTAQGVMDYFKSVKQSPEIPFDGERKPLKTSLKPNAMPSPINPFYKKKLKLNFSQ